MFIHGYKDTREQDIKGACKQLIPNKAGGI
jgi:adenine C2-methylase RlmN of 23S rRNA A2503 and tRNA A37